MMAAKRGRVVGNLRASQTRKDVDTTYHSRPGKKETHKLYNKGTIGTLNKLCHSVIRILSQILLFFILFGWGRSLRPLGEPLCGPSVAEPGQHEKWVARYLLPLILLLAIKSFFQ